MGHQHGPPKRLHRRRIRRPRAGPLVPGLYQVRSRFERSEQGEIQSICGRNEGGGFGSLSALSLSFRSDEYSIYIYKQFFQTHNLNYPSYSIVEKTQTTPLMSLSRSRKTGAARIRRVKSIGRKYGSHYRICFSPPTLIRNSI